MFYLLVISATLILPGLYYYYYCSACRSLPKPGTVKGKVVVCIGSTTGFGHLFVLKCLKEGMIVFAGCNSPEGIDKLKSEAEGLPGQVFPFRIDIMSQESIEEGFSFVMENLPDKDHGIDVLVNNAGTVKYGMDDWLKPDDYDYMWKINTLGTISVVHAFKELIKRAKGRIIICSSICGRIALPGFGPYTVSKYALEGYADTIRRELLHFGVRVCLIEPGFFRTPITDPNRISDQFDQSWEKADEHVKEEYGEEYKERQNELITSMLTSPLNCPQPEKVVEAYFKAATVRVPQARYVVGPDANLFYIPVARLSAGVQDTIANLIYWMVGFPKPRAVASQ